MNWKTICSKWKLTDRILIQHYWNSQLSTHLFKVLTRFQFIRKISALIDSGIILPWRWSFNRLIASADVLIQWYCIALSFGLFDGRWAVTWHPKGRVNNTHTHEKKSKPQCLVQYLSFPQIAHSIIPWQAKIILTPPRHCLFTQKSRT